MNPDLNNGEENPYDFIFKQDTPVVPTGNAVVVNKRKQILIFAAFVGVVLLVILIVFSVISSSSRDKATEAINALAYQEEISRIYELGIENVRDVELREKSVTLNLVLATDQQKLNSLIVAKGIEPTQLQRAQEKDSSRDKLLTDALQTGKHDEVFTEMLEELSGEYYAAARTAEGVAKNNRERATLSSIRKNIESLYLEQTDMQTSSPAPTTNTGATTPATAPEL